MRKLFLSLLLCSHFLVITFALGQAKLHEWTNKAGQTIKAKFVRGDADTVTLFLNGRNYLYQLSELSDESQVLARKLSTTQDSSAQVDDKLLQGKGEASYSEAEIRRVLNEHNRLRREVGTPDLKWDPKLARHAQAWANTMAREQFFEHSRGKDDEGENIAYSKGHTRSESIDTALKGWGEEEKVIYRAQGEPVIGGRGFRGVGHYTQMVWSETTHVGMATVRATGGKYYTCARYYPSGNTVGERPYPKSGKKPRR
ncbi:MAG: CAP domain-containing protein [Opitutales bacterium]